MFCFTDVDPWSLSRTMQIIIRDDTYRDVNNWRASPKSFLPKFGLEDIISGTSDSQDLESKPFLLMVEAEDTIAAVKAYIQEEKGISFKKQKLLKVSGGSLRDSQTLSSVGMSHGSSLILRYAPITRIFVKRFPGKTLKVLVEADATVGDVKAFLQENEGIPCHQQMLIYSGRQLMNDSVRLVNLGIFYESVLDCILKLCGC
ncbi:hypothetical protein RND71_010565 [Anisodus tanguticus]|uniref:Ubiquitin-like domain-containing protein n=1 Tax=Anisodus tanguticus TaxID=243964 RepID=A0AAE1SK03_9SOLA|nr:hypothetical protein RND71_010565 [Anisodus tanguticus]